MECLERFACELSLARILVLVFGRSIINESSVQEDIQQFFPCSSNKKQGVQVLTHLTTPVLDDSVTKAQDIQKKEPVKWANRMT